MLAKIFSLILKRFYRLSFPKWILRLLITGAVVGIILGIYWYKNKPICDKCNVILVSLDTLSALHLPCYGYERNTAPNLCAYADKNIQFMNSYSQSPITLDSHFSIFTSLYPHTHGMVDVYTGRLDEKHITLAQVFGKYGYQTVYNGPLLDEHMPINRGIERGFNVVEGSGIDKWKSSYDKLFANVGKNKPTFLFLHTYFVHSPYVTGHKKKHLFTDLPEYPNIALTWKEHNSISPEFLKFAASRLSNYVPTSKGSEKMVNTEKETAKKLIKETNFEEAKKIFSNLSGNVQSMLFKMWNKSKIDKNDKHQVEYLRALYDEQINNLDQRLKELFKLMEDPKLSKNTILIITADHGEEFMEHGELEHGLNLYATSTKVPLIMHIPGVKPKKIQELVQGIDIYPTALSLTGLAPNLKVEGLDLRGLILGKNNAKTNRYLRSEIKGITGMQYQNYRLYYREVDKKHKQLYDLAKDPLEQNNILSSNIKKVNEILRLVQ